MITFSPRLQANIVNPIREIISTEFDSVPLYFGDKFNERDPIYLKAMLVSDTINEMRSASSHRLYTVNFQLFIRSHHNINRHRSLDLASRYAERIRQLFLNFRNQLIALNLFLTSNGNEFIVSDGGYFLIPKTEETNVYNYHNLNLTNTDFVISEQKGYFVFGFNVAANVEEAYTS